MGRPAIHVYPASRAFLWRLIGPGQHYSYEWLAGQTGYSAKMLWMLATGRRKITKRFRVACAMALRIPEADLFEDCVEDCFTTQ